MKYLTITGQVFGKALMYEQLKKQGRRRLVPTYNAVMGAEKRPELTHHFAVTRDASDIIFGHQSVRFGTGGECPPNHMDRPYTGFAYHHPKIGTTLRLVEDSEPRARDLIGVGEVPRRDILVHRGPARSEGCFCIAGGDKAHLAWTRALQLILSHDEDPMTVFVEPRPEAHHTVHLSRARG